MTHKDIVKAQRKRDIKEGIMTGTPERVVSARNQQPWVIKDRV
jgi:hypothetical protein